MMTETESFLFFNQLLTEIKNWLKLARIAVTHILLIWFVDSSKFHLHIYWNVHELS